MGVVVDNTDWSGPAAVPRTIDDLGRAAGRARGDDLSSALCEQVKPGLTAGSGRMSALVCRALFETASWKNRRTWPVERRHICRRSDGRCVGAQFRPSIRLSIFNDADAMAAGIAATRGPPRPADPRLDARQRHRLRPLSVCRKAFGKAATRWSRSIRKSSYCGCGGVGTSGRHHGPSRHAARFLDMEPEEVFAAAQAGDARCVDS